MTTNQAQAFIECARERLIDEFLPRIKQCLDELSEENIWWRPNPSSNSAGNLMLHLCGNVRQWIVCGLGGDEDKRKRQDEFDEPGPVPKADLLAKLDETMREVERVLQNFDESKILEPCTIQGYGVTPLVAIVHVTEHFSYHLGQISYITKMRNDVDLKYYDLSEDGYAK